MTTTSPLTILPPVMAAIASSSLLNTFAGPLCTSISLATALRFTTQRSGARLPLRTAMPPVSLYGWSMGRMMSVFLLIHPLMFSAMVLPVTVITSVWSRFFLVSSFSTA